MDISQHEQGGILQPLMDDDPEFAKWVQRQRGWMSWFSPDLELIFTHACRKDKPQLKSAAPQGDVLKTIKAG